MNGNTLVRLLQLASPALPVGAYTYSQGMEWAVEAGTVRDATSAGAWLEGLLDQPLASFDAPLLAALIEAWETRDHAAAADLNDLWLASRETAELRAETLQMGHSLARLLGGLGLGQPPLDPPTFPGAWSYAAVVLGVPGEAAVTSYLWSWLENQVMAAVKLVPLGQSDGQRLLLNLGGRLAQVAAGALARPRESWSNAAPGCAIACSRHETQYSRLFRS